MKLTHKMMAAFALVVVVLVALMIAALTGMNNNQRAMAMVDHTYQVLVRSNHALRMLVNIETGQRGYIISGDEAFLDPYRDGQANFGGALAELRELTEDNPAQQRTLRDIENLYAEWMSEAISRGIDIFNQQGQTAAEAFVSEARGRERMERIRDLFDAFEAREESLIGERQEAAYAQVARTRLLMILGALIVVGIAIAAAWLIKRQLETRLDEAVHVASSIADGNLNVHIDEDGKDEVTVLMSAMSNMQTQLRHILTEIKGASTELGTASQSVSSTAEELSATSEEQSAASGSIAASVQQLSASIQGVADNAGEAERIATSSAGQTEDSAQVVENTVHSMERIAQVVRKASDGVIELGVQSEQISSIVNTIKGIADQTNLLALNAAIEAARAGEQGRGFSVVADEVRTLAQRTSQSTDEIESMVAKIQQGTRDAVEEMENGVEEVEQGRELGNQTRSAISSIRDNFEQVVAVVQDISAAMNEQNGASQEVARHVERFAESAQQNKEATEHTSSTAHQLQGLAQQLGQSVNRFRM